MTWKKVLWLIFYPFKDLDYFQIYYNIVQQIVLYRNVKFVLIFYLLNVLIALKASHFVYLALASGGSAIEIVINCDVYYLIVPKAHLNIIGAVVAILVLYYSHKLFGKANFRLIESLNSVMVLDDVTLFVESNLNNRNVCDQTRKCFLITLNFLMVIMFNFDLQIVGSYIYFAYNYYVFREHFFEKSFSYMLSSLVVSHLSHSGFALYIASAGHSIALNFANTMALLMMFYIKVRQACAKLAKLPKKKRFNLLRYIWFRKKFCKTLVFFFHVNRTYGRTFCALLVACCPMNILFTMWIIQGELGPISEFNLYSWIAYLVCMLFVLHLIFAYCSKHIHKPSKVYLHLIVQHRNQTSISTRTRAKLAVDICALHTTNRYGFTYGDFGLVSLATFTKFLMLYWKICMISYKLMKKRII